MFRSIAGAAVCLVCLATSNPATRVQARNLRAASAPHGTTFDVIEKSIEDLQRAMKAGEVTSRQLVDLYLARFEAYDKHGPALNLVVRRL